eukprot:GFUD01027179.1.p1 GENE.GFUD01027179.1~~GFUD01027179.1.p1  ORF type:complete len:397 (+),score=112.78 GFUD01027179.1:61-1251(+)
MAYKLEHSNEAQRSLLSSTVQKWSNSQPDMYMVSIEGHKVYTQRILLGLYSGLMDGLLSTPGLGDLPGISVPASSGCLVNLLKILTSGVAIANNKAHLMEATKAAEAIGIKLDNCQIGNKKKKPEAAKPTVAKAVVKVHHPATPQRKRKAQTEEKLPKKVKVKVPFTAHVKEEVEDQEEFNDLLLNGADVILKEDDGNQDGSIEGKVASSEKHQCSQCNKDFKSKQALKRHFLIHTDNPTPFGCDYCKKKYDRKYLLDNHTIKKHNIKTAHDELPEKEDDGDDVNNFDENETEDQSNLDEIREVEEEGNADQKHDDLENLELDENIIQGEEGMELEENNEAAVENEDSIAVNEAPDVSDDLVKDHEKLLSDRKKLLAELSNMEDDSQGDLDFLNGD